uniref:Leucine-rich repeat-containing protein 34 n=2 Tax=Lygus hesperus TaxID=30085 RepID=A0A0A9XMD7_LYGHE
MFNQLEHLDLGQTDQTVESLAWISQALMQSSSLKVLDLSRVLGYNGYVSDTLHFAIAFSDILRFCETLEELHLGKNSLTDTDLEQILFGLSFNKRLSLLDLASNRIGDQGAEMIAGALHYGAPLKALVLNTNRIGNLGARALSLKLPMSQIKLLDLAVNRITDQGIIDIVHTVKKPYPLLALFIFGNKLNVQALDVIQLLILRGDLNPESLDVTIFYFEGAIGHGHNSAADRYRPRYYKVPTNTSAERFGQKVSEYKMCRPECLDFKFHNIVNVGYETSSIPSNAMGPSCPV